MTRLGDTWHQSTERRELDWQENALCSQTDAEAFYPEKGGSARMPQKVCSSCEVREACLTYAIEQDERFGVWGGMTRPQRLREAKRRRRLGKAS